jgi:hypothetical protein
MADNNPLHVEAEWSASSHRTNQIASPNHADQGRMRHAGKHSMRPVIYM